MFNSIAVWHPAHLCDLSWCGSPHTLSITDVSLVCWFHLKVFTTLFLISEGTADIKISGLPVGGTVAAKRGIWEQYLQNTIHNATALMYIPVLAICSVLTVRKLRKFINHTRISLFIKRTCHWWTTWICKIISWWNDANMGGCRWHSLFIVLNNPQKF